jgi:hypothetical protein
VSDRGVILFDRPLRVHYGFIHLIPECLRDEEGSDDRYHDQTNGLCGAAHPGSLELLVGLHTGYIDVRVILADGPPPLGQWEDIVEVSLTSVATPVWFVAFDDGEEIDIPVGSYRVRWSASGMDADHLSDPSPDGATSPGRYELRLWPDVESRPDEILRVGSNHARYWHGTRRTAKPE